MAEMVQVSFIFCCPFCSSLLGFSCFNVLQVCTCTVESGIGDDLDRLGRVATNNKLDVTWPDTAADTVPIAAEETRFGRAWDLGNALTNFVIARCPLNCRDTSGGP